MRALMAALILAGGVWLANGLLRRWLGGQRMIPKLDVARERVRERLTAPPKH
jgi:hypothetical protein